MKNKILSFIVLALISCNEQRPKEQPVTDVKIKEQIAIKKTYFAIQPLGYYSNEDVLNLATEVENFYDVKVVIFPTIRIPWRFYDDSKSPRYSADSILHLLKHTKPDSVRLTLGITHSDIFTTVYNDDGTIKEPPSRYKIWGIFGLGYEPGRACVISDFRLKCEDSKKLFRRTRNVALHEIGHNLGLSHCPDRRCFMTDANESIRTVDNESDELCQSCKNKLNWKIRSL